VVYGSRAARQRRGARKGGARTSDWQPGKARCARDYVHEIIIVVDVNVGGRLNLEEAVNKCIYCIPASDYSAQ